MKIGKSVVNFSISSSSSCTYKYKSIDEVPYWSLYSIPGDFIQDSTGERWRNDEPWTLTKIIKYLKRSKTRRVLNAYPRQSTKRRNSYDTSINGDSVSIYDKWTGEVFAIFAIQDRKLNNVYVAYKAPSSNHYYRTLALREASYRGLCDGD